MEQNEFTSLYVRTDMKKDLEALAKSDRRSLVDEMDWLIQMEKARRAIREVAEKELKK